MAARRLLAAVGAIAALVWLAPPSMYVACGIAALVFAWPASGAARWAAGAAGERATARALEGLERSGWTVCHDLHLPGKNWNIDHLLVGPGGVVVVESKQWRRSVRAFRRRPRVYRRRVAWQVAAVAEVLGRAGDDTPVVGFLCIHGGRVRRLRRSIPVGDGRHLRRWVERLPAAVSAKQGRETARRVARTFD